MILKIESEHSGQINDNMQEETEGGEGTRRKRNSCTETDQ